jgi:sugar/nucleoside kinase (ribokinase family)
MDDLNVSICGFGDNVVDIYEHIRTMFPGGNCVNFAVYGKKAGVRRAAYMGYFGSDGQAEHVIESLHEEGIETIKCKQLLGENGYSCVSIAEDGDRIWGDYNQGGIRGETSYVLDRFDLEYLKGFDVVHSGNYCYTERQLCKIHDAGIALSFDFSDDSSWEYYEQIAPNVTYAFFSASSLTLSETKDRLKKVHALGPKWVSATRGIEGCYAFDGKHFYRQESKPVEHMADAMGAGDSFLTAFLVKSIDCKKRGMTEEDSYTSGLEFAAKFASNVCCAVDGSWGHGLKY